MEKIIKNILLASALFGTIFSANVSEAVDLKSEINNQNVYNKAIQLSTVDSRIASKTFGGSGHSPEGVITSFISPANNQITLTGKVYDRDAMDKPVTLQVYIGNDLGGSARFKVTPNKTFTYTYNVKNVPGKQAYTVYAIDEYGNNRKDAKIASGTVYVNGDFNHSPEGVITSFYSPAPNQITLTGTVYDRDDMNKNIVLQVYIGNDLGGSDRFTVCPNQPFTHTYTVKNVPGRQAYSVYAIDDYGPNRQDSKIGSGSVDVKTPAVQASNQGQNKISDALNWLNNNLGRQIGVNKQCVSTVKAYAERLGLPHPVDYGNACDYAYNNLNSGWTRVENGVPQAGDILVYRGGKYGHVAIYAGNNIIYESNMSDKVYGNNLRKRNRAYNKSWYSSSEGGTKYYWGYIRPNV